MGRAVALVDGRLGLEIARYLEERGELAGLVLHPAARRHYIDERDLLGFQCWVESWPHGLEMARGSRPDYLVSVQFLYRITKEWLELPNCQPLNLHPGFLPDNRGRAPTAWPILDGSRAGVTLHVMTEEFDAGPWLTREEVPTYPEDTGQTLAERVEATALCLFRHAWPKVGELDALTQEPDGAYHSRAEITAVTLAGDEVKVVDKLRARAYGGNGLRFQRDGHVYEVRVDINRVDD